MALPARRASLRYTEMSGAHRSALVLMSLDESVAQKLLSHLSEEDIAAIGDAMADLEVVEPPAIEAVLLEFTQELLDAVHVPVCGRDFALHVLPTLVGEDRQENVRALMERELSTEFVDLLGSVPPVAIASILRDEHPQVRAIALLLMGEDQASSVLGCMTENEQYEVTRRMSQVSDLSESVVRDVQASLCDALGPSLTYRLTLHGVGQTARTLSRMGREYSEPILARIAKTDKSLSEAIRRNMVLFSDLTVLQDRAIQSLLKEVDAGDLLLAMRAAPESLREVFLRNVSQRRRNDLLEELDVMAPVTRTRAEEAQQNVVEIALRLHEEGTIFFPIGADAEELV